MTAKEKRRLQSQGVKFGCHIEIADGEEPDGCVKDWGDENGCVYASRHKTREGCRYWQMVGREVQP